MYFASRTAAGKLLADQIAQKHAADECVIIGLSDGSVMVGAQIALKLNAPICLLLIEPIELPREGLPIGGITEDGSFAYNGLYSQGEIDELMSEYRNYVDEIKSMKLGQLHKLLGAGSSIRPEIVRGKIAILVSDGLLSGFSLDVAAEYLKKIEIKKLIVAVPLASVPAVDRMHVLGDEIFCLNVVQDYITTDHYYDVRDVPPHKTIVSILEKMVQKWQ